MSARYQPPSFNWINERELFIKLFDGDNQQRASMRFLENARQIGNNCIRMKVVFRKSTKLDFWQSRKIGDGYR